MGESKVVLKMKKMPRRHVIYFILAAIVVTCAIMAVIFPAQEALRRMDSDSGYIDGSSAGRQGDLGKYEDVVKSFRSGGVSDAYAHSFIISFRWNSEDNFANDVMDNDYREVARVHHDTEEARASFLPRVAAVGSAALLALITLLLISKSRKAVRDSTPQ
jgi:hypothetical protein